MISHDIISFEEATIIIGSLLNITKSQHATVKVIDVIIVKAKLSMIEAKFDEADVLLKEALQLAKINHLNYHEILVSKVQDQLTEEIKSISDTYSQNKSLVEKLENLKVFDYLNLLIKEKDQFEMYSDSK